MEFLEAVRTVDDEGTLLEMLHARAVSLGFNAVAYFRPALTDLERIEVQEIGYPEGWADWYRRERGEMVDPYLAYIASTGRSIRFSKIAEKRPLTQSQRDFIARCDDFGLTDGYKVPGFGTVTIPTLGMLPYLGWFAFRQAESEHVLADTNVAYLEAIAQATHLQYTRISVAARGERPKLAPREVAILNWIATGKTNGEIATILGIASPTVATYVRRIFQKLNVVDRAAAAVKGVKLGLVHT